MMKIQNSSVAMVDLELVLDYYYFVVAVLVAIDLPNYYDYIVMGREWAATLDEKVRKRAEVVAVV